MAPDAIANPQRDYVFVVNPTGANGRTEQQWKKMLPELKLRLGKDCNICEALTTGPTHAVEIAREVHILYILHQFFLRYLLEPIIVLSCIGSRDDCFSLT